MGELAGKDNLGLRFNFGESIFKYRWPISLLLLGAILVGLGIFLTKSDLHPKSAKIEVLEEARESQTSNLQVVVEISGAVEKPGVYKFSAGARVEDALIAAGGVSGAADREWMERSLNRAARLSDGQKIYIPRAGEDVKSITLYSSSATGQASGGVMSEGLININTASQSQLEALPGIGPVYAQNIIEHRPYSNVEELLSKGALKRNVYEKIKDMVSVY